MDTCSRVAAFLVPSLDGSIPRALQEIKALCAHMYESRAVCLRVHARLHSLWQRELQTISGARQLYERVAPVLAQYGKLLVRFTATLRGFTSDDRVFRLILNRQLFVKLDQMHRGVDAVVLALLIDNGGDKNDLNLRNEQQVLLVMEQTQWEADRKVQLQLDKHRSGYTAVIQNELRVISEVDALLCETLAHVRRALALASAPLATGTDCGERLAIVLVVATQRDATGKARLQITKWGLALGDSADALVPAWRRAGADPSDEGDTAATCFRGDNFGLRSTERCRRVRSHSACHLCTPVVFAFEDLTATRSAEAFVGTHSAELGALFHRVELSLHFPHESELYAIDNDQALGVCEFGLANLSLHHEKA